MRGEQRRQQDALILSFIDSEGVCNCKDKNIEMSLQQQLDNYDKDIAECSAMLNHFIRLKNHDEITSWKRMLQSVKESKRRLMTT